MNVRYGTTEDANLLSELGAKTFHETFAKYNTPENINLYLKESFSPEIQLNELVAPDSVYIIFELKGTPIGYAQLIIGSKDEAIEGSKPLEIRRIYILEDFIGKGVGSELMQVVIQEARLRGCDCVWLGVWEENLRAISFYKKWGFHEVGTHEFTVGNDPQNDFIMELELT